MKQSLSPNGNGTYTPSAPNRSSVTSQTPARHGPENFRDFLAELYLYKSGLNRQEQKDVLQKAGGKWDPDKIREAILVYYEQAHELDEARILHS